MRKCFVAACLLSSLLSRAQPSGQVPAQPSAQSSNQPSAQSSNQPSAQTSNQQPGQPSAPLFPPVVYPRDYFRDPLDIPIKLAANFGELRPNHYHMGLDIRTQHRENLPVFAAADGYVARVEIEPAGFGQAIYIRHPNGYTTVYGHLNQFFPALAAYIGEQQYKRESWQTDLELPATLFPVKKGDLIAYSGSTGGSQGPHLHFEIRRTAGDINQNPLLFGLPVPDNTSPSFVRLAWYDRNQGIYEQSPHILPVRREGGNKAAHISLSKTQDDRATVAWTILSSSLTVPTSRVSFAISAFDTQSGSVNPNGIFEAILYKDEQAVIGFQMNNISYDDTRNLNAHIDYRTRAAGGPFLQHLSLLPGYPPPTIYASPAGRPSSGVIDLSDGQMHVIRIVIKDTYGNASALSFRLQYRPAPATVSAAPGGAAVGARGAVGGGAIVPGAAGKKFYPGMVDGVETEDCAFYLGEKSLYDSVTIATTVAGYPGSGLSLPGAVSAAHVIGSVGIPLLQSVLVRLRPLHPVLTDSGGVPASGTASGAASTGAPASVVWSAHRGGAGSMGTAGIVMVRFQGGQKDVQLPEWQNGWASARFREFGNFQLVLDTIAPVVTPLGSLNEADLSRATRIAFSIKDNLGALRNFRAELDGAWLCFTNDKGLAYIYKFDQHCTPGRHTLRVSVEDVAGNRTVKEYHFNR
ncbi:MAG TPA: peptidoglycan DD-metalloendopeptidase family protein [Puia sp.]|jgi:murein DD-endopeptidase MepM/ murein hydrolase activator NlpD